ncbi:ATP-dependent exoDNAse (exonuclease V) beta subunit (contains helicase and exonuclease domains) [Saccharicrinis carchari]|uniref:DNA 3'-5' helicase n=1 Tax=Saccharicrinis carchari TaxID=1168039 RepID=A0A521ANZ8_SACCC|nr:UvrD-helicase domain-containing protein [Saccharicrinis carchari]SMO36528.1 ATP-dependent exoDNAse (exonuclease V) beta subunit (contains helicase and exonuclease domains) [Saccharicrinis carchari]
MSQLKIYRASAGSGKTFTLTKEYLFLLFANPNSYLNTLAVTFTNKATGEMKSRILEKLFEISTNKTDDYVADLMAAFKLNEGEVRKKAQVLLSYLLHDFSNFSVSTIDSFFQRIIRSFAREAGLESGFKIELNTSGILQKAVDHLLMKIDLPEHAHLKDWLVRFAQQKLSQGKSWNLSNDLNSLGTEIFNELFQLESRDIFNSIGNKTHLQDYLNQILVIVKDFEAKMQNIGQQGSSVISKSGLPYDAFTGKSRTPLKYFEKLKELRDFEPTATLLKIIDEPEKWGRKENSLAINQQIADIYPSLNNLIKKALDLLEREFEIYNTAKVIAQNYFALGIIADIAREVQAICRDENIFLIADSSHFLHKIIDQNDTPFIYEKMGTRFQNFMIDEFQDTSKLQWLNFKPLIENSLATDQTSLIVGDVKQSIYRWRNSDWNLLANAVEHDFAQYGSQTLSLDKNWRSLSNIVAFNNTLFVSGAHAIQNDFNALFADHIQDQAFIAEFGNKISQAYADVHQHTPSNLAANQGHIRARFYAPDKALTYDERMLSDMVQHIEKLVAQGYRYSDFCVLVRKKDEGETVANALLSGTYSESGNGIPVISNESLFLSGSSAVNFMMAQIKYLHNPNNLILKAEMVLNHQLLHAPEHTMPIEVGKLFDLDTEKGFAQQAYEWINQLLTQRQKPLLELVEMLAYNLPPDIKEKQGIYIQAFINCTNQFIKDYFPDLSAFIEWWDDKGKTEAVAVPDNQEAIKIMTIHKSKGLEFKVVLIPYCNWKLDTEINNNIIWCRPNKTPFNQIPLLPVTYTSRLQNTQFKEDYFKERLYQYVDSLNLLYVATTRSCEVLLTYGDGPSKTYKKQLKSVSDLMYLTIDKQVYNKQPGFIDLAKYWDKENGLLCYGEIPKPGRNNNKSEMVSEVLKPFTNKLLDDVQIAIKTDSDDYFTTDGKQSKINYGKVMHEAFEYIRTAKDIDSALTKMLFEGKLSENEKQILNTQIASLISKPETKAWFDPANRVKSENAILTKSGTYRPDRVVFLDKEVHVIDYKFGDKQEPKYEKQVAQYVRQVKDMGHSKVKGYIWYVTLNKIVPVSTGFVQGSLF